MLRICTAVVALPLAALSLVSCQSSELNFEFAAVTGPPTVQLGRGLVERLRSADEHASALLTRSLPIVEVHHLRSDLHGEAWYSAVPVGGLLLTYVVDGDSAANYRLALDLNADGDLSNDMWRQLTPRDGAMWPDAVGVDFSEALDGVPKPFALTVAPDKGHAMMHLVTQREGAIHVAGRKVRFAFVGQNNYDRVYIDTDGDGEINFGEQSDEAFQFDEPLVKIGDQTYAWSMDPDGDRLSLELSDQIADHVRLGIGSAAPSFVFTDIAGNVGTLEEYRGQVVLLYFWGTWCVPCRATTETLRNSYAALHTAGFDVLGISNEDAPESVREYVANSDIPWRQIVGDEAELVFELYGIEGYPRFVLIDQFGAITGKDIENLDAEVMALVAESTSERE